MDRAEFFKALRQRNSGLFGTSLSQKQVEGTEAVVNECMARGATIQQAAYILATAYGETGGKMQPVEENLRYSAKRIPQVFSKSRLQGRSPQSLAFKPVELANTVYGGEWGRRNLGNTEPGDGWKYRGMGIGQITGRANFQKWSISMDMDLVGQPELLLTLETSVAALVQPMLEGWATGHKLSDTIDPNTLGNGFLKSRRVWNGMFEAPKYARYAVSFLEALQASGYAPAPIAPDVEPVETPARRGFFSRLFGG